LFEPEKEPQDAAMLLHTPPVLGRHRELPEQRWSRHSDADG
jgi:hypothetical protein